MTAIMSSQSADTVCVITPTWTFLPFGSDVSTSMISIARTLRRSGRTVHVLGLQPGEVPADARSILEADGIAVFGLPQPDDYVYELSRPQLVAFAALEFIRKGRYSAVVSCLEGGATHYCHLAKRTGGLDEGLQIIVVAHEPLEWQAEADKFFFDTIDQTAVAFMERQCCQWCDHLAFVSEDIQSWMIARNWTLCDAQTVVPALLPREWRDTELRVADTADRKPRSEIVVVSGPRQRDGLQFVCDTLDVLAAQGGAPDLVTFTGAFASILGEHTGGLVLRRGRRWPFEIRFALHADTFTSIRAAADRNAVVLVGSLTPATPYAVDLCLEYGARFVAARCAVHSKAVAEVSLAHCVANPDPESMAKLCRRALTENRAVFPRYGDPIPQRMWNELVRSGGKRSVARQSSKTQGPLVSVIITHYERPQYLLQAVASVHEQTYANCELIIVDDGSSSEASRHCLDQIESRTDAKKTRVIRTENRYVGAARNTGIKAAQGKYVVIVDDDNALLPHAVDTFVRAIEHSRASICSALGRSFYSSRIPGQQRGSYVSFVPLGGSLDLNLLSNQIGDTISIYERAMFKRIGHFLEKRNYMVEDLELFVRAMTRGEEICVVPEVLFWYRVDTGARYRSSHYYDNVRPILDRLKNGQIALPYAYETFIGQNMDPWVRDSLKSNLYYSPGGRLHVELAGLDPNSPDAIAKLAQIASSDGRDTTALSLLAGGGESELRSLGLILADGAPSSTRARRFASSLAREAPLSAEALSQMEILSIGPGTTPRCVVGDDASIFVEVERGAMAVMSISEDVPPGTLAATATVELDADMPCEVLVCLVPMHFDPEVAIIQATRQANGSSGWVQMDRRGARATVTARLEEPSAEPLCVAIAIRKMGSRGPAGRCLVTSVSVTSSLSRSPEARPGRTGPGLRKTRPWSNAERTRARLITSHPSELPLLLFPKGHHEGVFLRPHVAGATAAVIQEAFPSFATELLAQVEIAHAEAGPFEFAAAICAPHAKHVWVDGAPVNPVAFSGWVTVESRLRLHDIIVRVPEPSPMPLPVILAIRLPRGISPSPAHAYWRNLTFAWREQ